MQRTGSGRYWASVLARLVLCLAVLQSCGEIAVSARESEDATVNVEGKTLQPIRITPYYHSSVDLLSEEQKTLVKDVLINATLSWLCTVLKVQPQQSPLTFERSCSVTHRVLRWKRYCIGTCSPTTQCGPISIPEQHLQPCRSCVGINCTESSHKPAGLPDTDLVVYVSAITDTAKCRSQLVYGGHCQKEKQLDRPTAAYLNLCPTYLHPSSEHYDLHVSSVMHGMMHALAFSESLFPFFRDEQGNPRNERDREGLPLRSHLGRLTSDGTVRYFSHTPWLLADYVRSTVDGLVGPPVHKVRMVITPNVVREVQAHFSCSDVIGGELESQKPTGSADSFWEKRVFGEELMTASASYRPILSRISLALLHDSGWYVPDYSYGGQLQWGRGRGCGFIEGSCYKWVGPTVLNTSKEEVRDEGNMDTLPFCNRSQMERERCVDQRYAIGVCKIKSYPAKLPEQFRYFSTDRRGGTFSLVDYCPVFQYDFYSRQQVGRNCMDTPAATASFVPEVYGRDSRCFEHVWTRDSDSVTGAGDADRSGRGGGGGGRMEMGGDAGCYRHRCSKRRVILSVAGQELRCRVAGQKKVIDITHNNVTYLGKISCPAYEDVCANYDCPGMCSGRGSCDEGHCRCHHGYYGYDCSRSFFERLVSCNDLTMCHNGGSCTTSTSSSGGSVCVCAAGFTGAQCETELVPDPCQTLSCTGNYRCVRSRMGTVAKCACVPGYGGDSCEIDDPCLPSPCFNGSTCTSGVDSTSGNLDFECSCTPGFKGRRCNKQKNPCRNPNPCHNGGECDRISSPDTHELFQCICPAGYTGLFCDDIIPVT